MKKSLSLIVLLLNSLYASQPRSVIIMSTGLNSGGISKFTDVFADLADVIVRSQTVPSTSYHKVIKSDGDEFYLEVLPTGILRKNTICYLTMGMEIDPSILFQEIDTLKNKNRSIEGRLWISSRAHIVMPYHRKLDGLMAKKYREGADIGARKGVGAAASDKRLRIGIRIADLLDENRFKKVLKESLDYANEQLTKIFSEKPFDFNEIYKLYTEYARRLKPYVKDDVELQINRLIIQKKGVIFEGTGGAFSDVSTGLYPYVASSSTSASGILTGAGVGPGKRRVGHILGVTQCYTTRVGAGPLPSEITEKHVIEKLKVAHQSYHKEIPGIRYGWVDLVMLREAILLNGIDSLAISKLDELDDFDEVKICYDYIIDGKNYDYLPSNVDLAKKIEPRYITMKGWKASTRDARRFTQLPEEAKAFIKKIETLSGAPVSCISVGPRRDQIIHYNDLLPF